MCELHCFSGGLASPLAAWCASFARSASFHAWYVIPRLRTCCCPLPSNRLGICGNVHPVPQLFRWNYYPLLFNHTITLFPHGMNMNLFNYYFATTRSRIAPFLVGVILSTHASCTAALTPLMSERQNVVFVGLLTVPPWSRFVPCLVGCVVALLHRLCGVGDARFLPQRSACLLAELLLSLSLRRADGGRVLHSRPRLPVP